MCSLAWTVMQHQANGEEEGDTPFSIDDAISSPSPRQTQTPPNHQDDSSNPQSCVLPNPDLTYIGAANFPLWFQHKLSRKYFFHLDRLLMAIKPALLLLKDARTAFEEIGTMVGRLIHDPNSHFKSLDHSRSQKRRIFAPRSERTAALC